MLCVGFVYLFFKGGNSVVGDWFIYTATALDILAGVFYFNTGDIPRAIYWLGAAVATFATIFMTGGR